MKRYYTIKEVAEIFNIETSMIRYWETQFGDLHTKRRRKVDRLFTINDIERINKIYFYLKVAEHTIAGTKRQLGNQYFDNTQKEPKKIGLMKYMINRINLFN